MILLRASTHSNPAPAEALLIGNYGAAACDAAIFCTRVLFLFSVQCGAVSGAGG